MKSHRDGTDVYVQVVNLPKTRRYVTTMSEFDGCFNEMAAADLANVPDDRVVAVLKMTIDGRPSYLVVKTA